MVEYTLVNNVSGQYLVRKSVQDVPIWLRYLFVSTVFSKEIGHVDLFGIDYDFIGYNFCIIYLIWHLNNLYVSRKIILFLFAILASSIFAKAYLNLQFSPLFKQFVPTAIIFLVNFDFFARVKNHVQLFKIYITISYFTAIFGILQLLVKAVFGIKLLTAYGSLFIDSVAYEPSHYAALILPASVYSVMNFRNDKKRALAILLAMFGTFSTTSYTVMAVALVLIFLNPLYLIIVLPVMFYLYNYVFLSYDKFSSRISGFEYYYQYGTFDKLTSGTPISFLSNYEVARYTINKSPIVGSGMGGHEEMYFRFFKNSLFSRHYLFGINAASAHSLILRILSEFGIVGIFFYGWFLLKHLLLNAKGYHRIISIACLTHFLCKFLKLGGYFDYGTPFFAMMLIFNFQDYLGKRNR